MRSFILMFLIGLSHFMVDTMLGIWPVYKSIIEFDIAKAGLIVACGAFIGEGAQLFFGVLSDRGLRKTLIIIGLLLAQAAAFFASFNTETIFLILYILTCIGSGAFHPCAASYVGGLVPSRRASCLTLFAACGSLGLATSQLSFTAVREFFNGQTALLAAPALLLAFFLIFTPLHENTPPLIKEQKDKGPGILHSFKEFFKHPTLRALYFSQVANQTITWGTIFILPDVLLNLEHSDWICFGGGHLCFILGAACMMLPGGLLSDIYSTRQVMLYGSIISTLCFYLLMGSYGWPSEVVLPLLFLLGATLMLMNPLALSLGAKIEPNRTGAVSAFLMGLVWCVSETLGPGGVGLMTRLFNEGAAVKALSILGLFFIIQIIATIRLPKDEEKKAIPCKEVI